MKAFLLAAGLGTRLRPLTDKTPKCMLPVAGKPLLDIWLDAFAAAGVDEVLLNLHHLPDLVSDHLARRSEPPAVTTAFEPELLGSAGTLLANREWLDGEDMFLVCYADNLTDFPLQILVDAHRCRGWMATLALFHAPEPTACGIVGVDATGLITSFVEKPTHPASDLANAGVYAFSPDVLDLLTGRPPLDIGYDLLPKLVGQAHGVVVDGYFLDIGTPAAYERAQNDWKAKALR